MLDANRPDFVYAGNFYAGDHKGNVNLINIVDLKSISKRRYSRSILGLANGNPEDSGRGRQNLCSLSSCKKSWDREGLLDVNGTITYQAYAGTFSLIKAKQVVQSTKGQIMTYDRKSLATTMPWQRYGNRLKMFGCNVPYVNVGLTEGQ